MKYILLSLVTLLTVSSYADDALWFEKKWISDKVASRVANPAIEHASKEMIEKFSNLFGRTRWEITGGILTTISEKHNLRLESTYTINPSVNDTYDFEIVLIDDEGSYTTFYIWRIETGFCMNIASSISEDIDGGWSHITWKVRGVNNIVECFKHYNA